MREWTEQEEQEMIERAKAGDPEANYELSLWALERSEEDPDDPRWGRLAAKCLVKASQAGYEPAQEKLSELLAQSEPPQKTERPAREREEDELPRPVRLNDARQAARKSEARASTGRKSAPRETASERRREIYDDEQDDLDDDDSPRRGLPFSLNLGRFSRQDREERPARTSKQSGSGRSGGGSGVGAKLPFANWGERQWRTMELICIAVCVALVVFIAVMLFTGRGSKDSGDGGASGVPAAGVVGDGSGNAAVPADYPSAEIKARIGASDLEIIPDELDYVKVPTTGAVSVGSVKLRLRTGPNTDYSEVTSMDDGTEVSVYAEKGGWYLVLLNDDTWGWCNKQYIIITGGSSGGGDVG